MSTAPRFEVVRTHSGWHARFIAGNGETVWTTEVLTKAVYARHAIDLLASNKSVGIFEVDERRPKP